MTLGEFLEAYSRIDPFWVNYPDDTGFFDADYYASKDHYEYKVSSLGLRGEELPYNEFSGVEYITHDGDGILTIELAYDEDCIDYHIVEITSRKEEYLIDSTTDLELAQMGARSVYESCQHRAFIEADTAVELRAYKDGCEDYELIDF